MLYEAGYALFQGMKMNEEKTPTFTSGEITVCGFHRTGENEDWEALIFICLFSDRSAIFFSLFAILYFSQGEQRRRNVGVFFLNRF